MHRGLAVEGSDRRQMRELLLASQHNRGASSCYAVEFVRQSNSRLEAAKGPRATFEGSEKKDQQARWQTDKKVNQLNTRHFPQINCLWENQIRIYLFINQYP